MFKMAMKWYLQINYISLIHIRGMYAFLENIEISKNIQLSISNLRLCEKLGTLTN